MIRGNKKTTADKVGALARGVPTESTARFCLENYIEKDHSRKKKNAAAFGKGDYKEIIRRNMER